MICKNLSTPGTTLFVCSGSWPRLKPPPPDPTVEDLRARYPWRQGRFCRMHTWTTWRRFGVDSHRWCRRCGSEQTR